MTDNKTRAIRLFQRKHPLSATLKRNSGRPGLVYLATSSVTIDKLMRGHLRFMQEAGFEVEAICGPGPELPAIITRESVQVTAVPMEREIEFLSDFASLLKIFILLRNKKPAIVNAGTPKAGMIGMIAAYLAGVPIRVYTLRGLRAETSTGLTQRILKTTERIAAWCATDIICVSNSLASLYAAEGLADSSKIHVLGSGSSGGVDTTRYRYSADNRDRIRGGLGIADDTLVVGFVGRLVSDKGVEDLISAFRVARERVHSVVLLLVGGYEDGDRISSSARAEIECNPDIFVTGFVDDASPFYSAFDVFAFPSYREGFPNSPLEAASTGIPCVAYDATGTRDAVVDGVTGALVPVGQTARFAESIIGYLLDGSLRETQGKNGRQRAVLEFERGVVLDQLLDHYVFLLSHRLAGSVELNRLRQE